MKIAIDVRLTPEQVADAFCDLDDDEMARFFVEAARIEATWAHRGWQWPAVGGHLKSCECATDAAREMVRDIARAIDPEAP